MGLSKTPQERLGELINEKIQIENAFQQAEQEQNARKQSHAEIIGAMKILEEFIAGAEQEAEAVADTVENS